MRRRRVSRRADLAKSQASLKLNSQAGQTSIKYGGQNSIKYQTGQHSLKLDQHSQKSQGSYKHTTSGQSSVKGEAAQ